MQTPGALEAYFSPFRANIIGQNVCFDTPFGRKRLLYADWTASGRAYRPIEMELTEHVLPFFGNTHTETTVTGTRMSQLYAEARKIIKKHVHAGQEDVLIFCGSGMTSAVNKLQRLLGLRLPEHMTDYVADFRLIEEQRPLVLVTHMEHHSNHTSWLETIATVKVIRPDEKGQVDLDHLREILERYQERRVKIAAVTACSNVTGIETQYREIARIMHNHGGLCFVDFACSAPYIDINMHPGRTETNLAPEALDAIYFSMHKFLGGPGTPGVLVLNRKLYENRIPDQPGGGTLLYSNPWGGRAYIDDIETREDGGTPPILQSIKAGFCIRLKEEMGVAQMLARETALVTRLMDRLSAVPGVEILAERHRIRLGVVSFLVKDMHHDVVVQRLNDRFGVACRGGCSCAGTYGHFLLGIDKKRSETIRDAVLAGDLHSKPGWVRLSLHPTMSDEEIDFIADAVEKVVWEKTTTSAPGRHCYPGLMFENALQK